MDYSRIKEIEAPEYELLDADQWDRTSFTEQLEGVQALGKLMEEGLEKLPTAWGVMQDLFTVFFSAETDMKPIQNPALVVNQAVLNVVWKLEETERLKIHTTYRRTAATDAIVRLGKAILDAIPPEAAQMQQELLDKQKEQDEQDGQGGSPEGDEGDPGDGPAGSRGDPGGDSEERDGGDPGAGAGQPGGDGQDGDGDQPGGDGGDGAGSGSGDQGSAAGEGGSPGQGGGPGGAGGAGAGGGGPGGQGGQVPPGRGSGGHPSGSGAPGAGGGGQGRGGTPGAGAGAQGDDRGRGGQPQRSSDAKGGLPQRKDQHTGGPDKLGGKGPGRASGADGGPSNQAIEELRTRLDRALKQAGPQIKDAIQRAASAAAADAKDLSELKSSQGWDLSKDLPGAKDPSASFAMAQKLKDDPRLLQWLRKIGNKLRTFALAKHEQKPVGEGFTVVSRTIGADLTRVPLDEAWRMTNPKMRIFTAIDLAEAGLPQDEYREIHEGKKGDSGMLWDISISTLGRVHEWSCMMALAMQAVFRKEGRKFWVIPFNTEAWPCHELTRPTLDDLMRFAAVSPSGGTSFEAALDAGIERLKKSDSKFPPDLIVLTDGECRIPNKRHTPFRSSEEAIAHYKRVLDTMKIRLKVVYVGVAESMIQAYPELVNIAGESNKFLLKDIFDWEGIGRLFESL